MAVLDTARILLAGLPDIARSERVIHTMSRMLGKVVVVDELSLRKEEEVRVKIKSLGSSKLRATVRMFFNDLGYDIRILPEPLNYIGGPRFTDDGTGGGDHGGHGAVAVAAPSTVVATARRRMTTLSLAALLLGIHLLL